MLWTQSLFLKLDVDIGNLQSEYNLFYSMSRCIFNRVCLFNLDKIHDHFPTFSKPKLQFPQSILLTFL